MGTEGTKKSHSQEAGKVGGMNASRELMDLHAQIADVRQKFEALVEQIRELTCSDTVLVCLVNGFLGTGCTLVGPPEIQDKLPELLHAMAHDLEEKIHPC